MLTTLALALATLACKPKNGVASPSTLAEQTVSVPAGGGGATIAFTVAKGQKVRITMTSATPAVEPYGHIDMPDGIGEYVPKNETAKPGFNVGELVATQAGQYRLTVFDSSNQGGVVTVKVEAP